MRKAGRRGTSLEKSRNGLAYAFQACLPPAEEHLHGSELSADSWVRNC